MPQVRMLVRYPGDPHPTGAVVELEAPEASELVTTGRAEYIREPGIERAVLKHVESTTPQRMKSKGRTP